MENWRLTNLTEGGLNTVGDLINVIQTVKRDKMLKKGGKLIAKLATGGLFDPDVADFLGAAMDAGDFASSLYGGDLSDKKPPPGLAAIAIEPDISKIVDDDIEKAFLKHLSAQLEELNPETPLSQVNTTVMLQDFIAQNFNNKTVKDS